MFKNKTFMVKMLDDKKVESQDTDSESSNSPETIALEVVAGAAGAVTAGFVLYKIVDTLSQIAVHTATVKIK